MNPVRLRKCVALVLLIGMFSCAKDVSNTETKEPAKTDSSSFTIYTIQQGNQYCDQEKFTPIQLSRLDFIVRFDSSAIYKTANPNNQGDVNKLIGFSDNSTLHHEFSARFGWRWNKNALSLQAYVYNDGKRSFKDLGVIEIGKDYTCSIVVDGDHYSFLLNNKITEMPRTSAGSIAEGYKLFPYFGGDEVAPHTVTIQIREEKGF